MRWATLGTLFLLLLPVGAQQQFSYPRPSYVNISNAAIKIVKSSAGTLHYVVINSNGGNPCVAVVYDSTTNSGTKIATIDCTTERNVIYELDFANGLTIDTTGDQTPADMTVSYN